MNVSSLVDGRPSDASLPTPSHPRWPCKSSLTLRRGRASGASQSMAGSEAPPSPPVEDPSSLTLPSIRNLIGIVDANRSPGVFASSHDDRAGLVLKATTIGSADQDSTPQAPAERTDVFTESLASASCSGHSFVGITRGLPLTPPLRPGSGLGSGSKLSRSSAAPSPSWPTQQSVHALNNTDPQQQRQQQAPIDAYESGPRRLSQSSHTSVSYASSPSNVSSYSFPSPNNASISNGMLYQRPLPSMDSIGGSASAASQNQNYSPIDQANPWQHHHYIAHSSSSQFASQQADRYICNTCNKAFSRPSSLRIHSHSHTGEKPYKCPHTGCDKAFSVRSNMKRHERGCHGGLPGQLGL